LVGLLVGGLLEVSNHVSSICLGLEAREVHLGLGDVLLGVELRRLVEW